MYIVLVLTYLYLTDTRITYNFYPILVSYFAHELSCQCYVALSIIYVCFLSTRNKLCHQAKLFPSSVLLVSHILWIWRNLSMLNVC